jgi:hypothetical protein
MPDGKHVLTATIAKDHKSSELWIVSLEGGEPKRTGIVLKGAIGSLSLHPDGKQLSYGNQVLQSDLWSMQNFLPIGDQK